MSAVHAHNLNMHHVVRRDDKCSMVFSLVYYKTKTRLKFVSVTFAFNVYLLLAKHFNCSSGLFRSIGISCQPSQPPVLAIAFAHLARYTQTHTQTSYPIACGRCRRFNYISFIYWLHYNLAG